MVVIAMILEYINLNLLLTSRVHTIGKYVELQASLLEKERFRATGGRTYFGNSRLICLGS